MRWCLLALVLPAAISYCSAQKQCRHHKECSLGEICKKSPIQVYGTCARFGGPVADCRNQPEVRLDFGPDGTARDISKNNYNIITRDLETFESSPGSRVYAGQVNETTTVKIFNANLDPQWELTIRVVYETTQNMQNASVVADVERDDSVRAVSIVDDGGSAKGCVRTSPNNVITVNTVVDSRRKEVIVQYTGHELVLDDNGNLQRAAAGAQLDGSPFCDGIHLGFDKDLQPFNGVIYELELFKCLAGGPQDFQRSARGL